MRKCKENKPIDYKRYHGRKKHAEELRLKLFL